MLNQQAKSKGITLEFCCAPTIPQWIHADEAKIRQILINLLGNAIKFTRIGGVSLAVDVVEEKVIISDADLAHEGSIAKTQLSSLVSETLPQPPRVQLHFRVTDTGPGLTPDEVKTVFHKFVQAGVGKASKQGTGLGLAISYKFVQLLGGELNVESVFGHGATFEFSIPLVVSTKQLPIGSQSSRRVTGIAANQPVYRILAVEDVWASRQLLIKLMEPFGWEIREATDGEEAIALWETWHPHLIWMDMRMPIMDGYRATQIIRQKERDAGHDPKTIILALTASAFEEERQKVLTIGCDDFIRKPFQEQEIFNKLAQYLSIRFCYEGDASEDDFPPARTPHYDTPNSLSPQGLALDITTLPESWRQAMSQAAQQLDEISMIRLIQDIQPQYPHVAAPILSLIENFDFETIVKLLT